MYNNNNISQKYRPMQMNRPNNNINNDDRFLGGFAVPFVLGGITGGLIANNRYNNYPMYYPVYPYYPMYPYNPYNRYY